MKFLIITILLALSATRIESAPEPKPVGELLNSIIPGLGNTVSGLLDGILGGKSLGITNLVGDVVCRKKLCDVLKELEKGVIEKANDIIQNTDIDPDNEDAGDILSLIKEASGILTDGFGQTTKSLCSKQG
ncbi:uncharacterized protein LOC129615455 [Condylostylus longicornis]|uniref:uncharacterized protein LOC129615455 n=1 Tax=Condylostylus longicornis TaxID=2530218 RepID=UPI00244E41C0|nr:uncharacterized protein LOC129615455 [Condylostylus longicornis]